MSFIPLNIDDDSDLAMKAPYIPMNMGDDLPLLLTDDLMWGPNDRDIKPENSHLAQLLCTSINNCLKASEDDSGGGMCKLDIFRERSEFDKRELPQDCNVVCS